MNQRARTFVVSSVVATLGSLMSNVVANYLPAMFDQQRYWAICLFVLLSAGSILFGLYQQGDWSPFGDEVPGLSRPLRNGLLATLLPFMQDEKDRHAIVYHALGDMDLVSDIDFSGAARPFTLNLLRTLVQRGNLAIGLQALSALLDTVHEQVGIDQQARVRELQTKIQAAKTPQPMTGRLRLATASILVVLGIFVWLAGPQVSSAWAQNAVRCPPARVCIGIADFTPKSEAATSLTDRVERVVRQVFSASESDRFLVRRLEQPVENLEQAQQAARADGDLLLVWGSVAMGSDRQSTANVYFELTDPMRGGEMQATSPYRAQPLLLNAIDEYCLGCVTLEATSTSMEVSPRVYVVAHMAAGLAHYVRYQSRRARLDFMAALYCGGETEIDEQVRRRTRCVPDSLDETWNPALLYYYVGKSYALEGDYRNAIDYLRGAATLIPQDPVTQIGVAAVFKSWLVLPTDGPEARHAIDRAPEVTTALERAITLSEELADSVTPELLPVIDFNLGLVHELGENLDKAQMYYQNAAEGFIAQHDDGAYAALVDLARTQRVAKATNAARTTLMQARALGPAFPWAYIELARVDVESRQQAEAWLNEAQTLVAQDDATVDIAKAELCTQWQDYTCAEDAYTRASQKQPELGRLYLQIGDFLRPTSPSLSHQNWTEAARYYQMAAAQWRPNDPWAHERLAYVLFQQGDYSGAAQQYEKSAALAYSPRHVPDGVYCMMAYAQENGGKNELAIESYRHCMEVTTDPVRKQTAQERIEELEHLVGN